MDMWERCRYDVYRLKEARKRNIQQLRTLHSKPGHLPPRDDEDDDDSGISSHGNGTGSISSPEFSKEDPLTTSLSSASLKNPAYVKARVLWDFTSTRFGTELSVTKGDIVHMLYREGDQVLVVSSNGKRGFIPLRYCTLLPRKIQQNGDTADSRHHTQCSTDSRLQKKIQDCHISSSRTQGYNGENSLLRKKAHTPSIPNNYNDSTFVANALHDRKAYHHINGSTCNSTNPHFGNKMTSKMSNHITERTITSSSSDEDSDYSFRGSSEYTEKSTKRGSQNGLDCNKNYIKNGYVSGNSHNSGVTENALTRYDTRNTYVADVKARCVTDNPQARYVTGNRCVNVTVKAKDSCVTDVKSRFVERDNWFRQRQRDAASLFRKTEGTKMLVLYDFIARDENDISVYKGETVVVLNRDDTDWWWIATREGYEGFVPSRYLSTINTGSSEGSTSTACSSLESSSSTSEGSNTSSTQGVRFQDPLCTFHRYEKEEWETDSEISRDDGYPVDVEDEVETGSVDPDKSRWSTWC